ncbi:hypothetical protein FOA43_002556 [Brettanomyces nanus]|uniref:Phosphatase PP2A regulatory subunit A/Splicing factor 3B subunit 1-like HEAT repeat domain-containing protein n=1 Tax=Eeniella nana TaxID=13502 RepID=A0A875S1F5_EENNA|nr:uncharacterized protein FOA43_002556 [Brettanomyces nanus]QPG75206.1 hypothetical protein FOA43_002556 [Brettanomyces nanus]
MSKVSTPGSVKGVVPYSRKDDDPKVKASYTMPKEIVEKIDKEAQSSESLDVLQQRIKERKLESSENDYKKRKYELFKEATENKTYSQTVKKRKEEKEAEDEFIETQGNATPPRDKTPPRRERKKRWDVRPEDSGKLNSAAVGRPSRWETDEKEKEEDDKKALILGKVPVVDGIELNDQNLTLLLPPGFKKVPVPSEYTPSSLDMPDFSSFNPQTNVAGYMIPEVSSYKDVQTQMAVNPQLIHEVPGIKDLKYFKDSDMAVFHKLISTRDIPDSQLSVLDKKERNCMKMILNVKNGSSQSRRVAMRQLTENASSFGPEILFDILLPLLMTKTLEEQERHLLVKMVGRVLFVLDDLVKPYSKKILVVMMPLLMDENLYSKLEGREVISNLSKAVGLAHMIFTLRPDIDHPDDYMRNLVSRTFAVVTSSLGVKSVLPFLKAVCNSKKSWLARHTGVRIVSQIALLMGPTILPYLNQLVRCVLRNIDDDNLSVRTMAANTISVLAEASKPYGFESLEPAIEPLWKGLKQNRGRNLAAFLRALGSLIPLMDEEYANYYAREVFRVISREFDSPDDRMKIAILKIIEECCSLETIDKKLVLEGDFLDDFFSSFWTRRAAMDRRISSICVDACYAISLKAGSGDIVGRALVSLKDESESFRRMAICTVDRIVSAQGSFELDDRAVNRLLDGLLYSLQNQSEGADKVVLKGFGDVLNSLGMRAKPHLMPIVSALLYRLKNKDESIREQAADMISKVAPVLKVCGEDEMLIRLGTILYESLGEVYPDVLGSILGALRSVISSLNSLDLLNPPISQILATLTPILRNRHEKVQETTINLIGDIAERAKDYINHREWMRISFEMLEMLKSSRKQIRISANKTFGLIAMNIGPSDVLVTLLNNLRVQERQLRVCTAVAIGIVAETCLPYTVLPAMMNEYRYPDKNVQNGILKALSFMYEYIGGLGSDYIYAITPLLIDAFGDRDIIHRQTASTVVKHMALGSIGQGYEDAFMNFLNYLWPNVLDTSPHLITRVIDAVDSLRMVLGCGVLMNYVLAGLFHPARRVRAAYWRIYNTMYVNAADSMVPYYPRFEAVGVEIQAKEAEIDLNPRDLGVSELDIWV